MSAVFSLFVPRRLRKAVGQREGRSDQIHAAYAGDQNDNGNDSMNSWLVVWNMNFMTLHSVGNVIIPTDELHHFSEG